MSVVDKAVFLDRWKAVNADLAEYKQNLSCALEIHSFNRDVDEMLDRINEKALLLSSEDLGKDLPSVEALQRKQEEVERDMTALQNQLEVGACHQELLLMINYCCSLCSGFILFWLKEMHLLHLIKLSYLFQDI